MVSAIRSLVRRRAVRLPAGPLRPAPHVRVARSEGRTLLLDEDGARYWGLDDVGGAIWAGIEERCDAPTIVRRLQAAYDAPAGAIEADASAFLTALVRARLVEAA
jgi:hypothetical protein